MGEYFSLQTKALNQYKLTVTALDISNPPVPPPFLFPSKIIVRNTHVRVKDYSHNNRALRNKFSFLKGGLAWLIATKKC